MLTEELCQCGCGQVVTLAKKTSARDGHTKGMPTRFIYRHHPSGSEHPNWKGGRMRHSLGYIVIKEDDKRCLEHRIIAENALGKPLPPGAVVHHHGARISDNGSGLVVCENQAYHLLLHARERAILACGNPNWRKCPYCHEYDDPVNMHSRRSGRGYFHNSCANAYNQKRKSARKEQGGAVECL
jgi:hypothetical protein